VYPSRTDLTPTQVNGETRQSGSTSGLIYSVAQLIAYASGAFTLRPGDTILTGTPKGVGRVYPGEHVSARMSRSDGSVLDSLELDVVSRDQGFRFDGKHWLTP
jgi:2-keto-4-pentenoate hydratase/2-oxohepta-3-ene-1,7-dioic acid hydratase in catechol pathway